jgi:hypothetical protein
MRLVEASLSTNGVYGSVTRCFYVENLELFKKESKSNGERGKQANKRVIEGLIKGNDFQNVRKWYQYPKYHSSAEEPTGFDGN